MMREVIEIVQNPWFVGIVGGVISAIIYDQIKKSIKKQRKILAVLLAIGLFCVVGVIIIFFVTNRSYSNGISRPAAEELYNRGYSHYNTGEYEEAIECFLQLPSDSKIYNDAQDMLKRSIELFRANIFSRVDFYAQSGQYNFAFEMLQKAQELLPEDSALRSKYSETYTEYKSQVMNVANRFSEENDLTNAVATIRSALNQFDKDTELLAALQIYENDYRITIIEQADAALREEGYQSAISIAKQGFDLLPDDMELSNRISEYQTYAPLFLYFEDAYLKNDYIRSNVSTKSLLTDNYGNVYTMDKVICNCDKGLFMDTGSVQYYLADKYSTLTGTVYVPDISKGINIESFLVYSPYVQIYGDGILLYELPALSGTDKPVNFSVDVTNVEFLTVSIYGGWYRGDGTGLIPINCVADLAVAK